MKFTKCNGLHGEITVPGDKSISHRAVMFSALGKGTSRITGFLKGADCLSTIACFRKLGISITEDHDEIIVTGNGLHGLKAPDSILDVGNSGTTTRLISGILSGQNFTSVLSGDDSLNSRPMKRIMTPLSMMGAQIKSICNNGCAPLEITGHPLLGIHYDSPVASAQVKSAILLAGLYADGITSVTEPAISRNHTELMLEAQGVSIRSVGNTVTLTPPSQIYNMDILVPGDISSAAFFMVAAAITPGSEVLIKNVGINETRAGIIKVMEAMGADLTLLNVSSKKGEPTADILVKHSDLTATTIEGDIIPTLIDELPVIALLACYAKGTTYIKDAAELKVKESNRIELMADQLSAMGANITATDDGFIIEGGAPLHGTDIFCKYDHRIAMTFAIASLNAEGETNIKDSDCVVVSYPSFYEDLSSLKK